MGIQLFANQVWIWLQERGYTYGSSGAGHFTQMVWKSTTHLGCGDKWCSGRRLYVCQYKPPGNVRGRYSQNVLPPTA